MSEDVVKKEDILETIDGAIDYLEKISNKKDFILEPIEEENYERAFQEFENMIDGIDVLNQLLTSLQSIGKLNLSELEYKDKSITKYINEFNTFLSKELIESMKNEDYQLVYDLLKYEFDEKISNYKEIFIFLAEYFEENME